MKIANQKRKIPKMINKPQSISDQQNVVSAAGETAASDIKKPLRATSGQTAATSAHKNKAYQRFKKLVEKTSIQKRQAAQVSSIKTRNELNKSRRKPAPTVSTLATANAEQENEQPQDTARVQNSYFDLNLSRQKLLEKRELFEKSLRELNEKLAFVKFIGTNVTTAINMPLAYSTSDELFEQEYVDQLISMDEESEVSLSSVKTWYSSQQREIERQFKFDQRQANREFQKKRADLKKKLSHKYDEMRRQVDAESPLLDINMDLHEMSKLPRTRNLRKRINTNVLMYNFECNSIDWLSLDAALAAKKSGSANSQHFTASCIDILARCAAGEHTSAEVGSSAKTDVHPHDGTYNSNLSRPGSSHQPDVNNNDTQFKKADGASDEASRCDLVLPSFE
jgi:hypothetical protein